jgi:hypothetical protein
MYTYLRSQGFKMFMVAEAPYFLVSFVIANQFYKWRSFGLELIGFMVTWYVLSAVGNTVVNLIRKRNAEQERTLS